MFVPPPRESSSSNYPVHGIIIPIDPKPPRNGTIKSITDIVHRINSAPLDPETEVVVAPPGLFLLLVREHLKDEIEVCSQNVFDKANGAFTGEISAEQLSDSKIGWALCGHSERRVILGEKDDVREPFSLG